MYFHTLTHMNVMTLHQVGDVLKNAASSFHEVLEQLVKDVRDALKEAEEISM